jgi:hypothetical protein
MPTPIDGLVYATPDGKAYVAQFDDVWYRWPAEAHGWGKRTRCTEAAADECDELPPRLAALALRLSGVPADA